MTKKFVVARLPTVDSKTRDELADKLAALSRHAAADEPGTLKYAVLVPRDEAEDTVVYVVEEYADDAAFGAHHGTDGVSNLVEWLGTGKVLQGEPSIQSLQNVEGLSFGKPEVTKHTDPYVTIGTVDYKEGAFASSVPYWKNVVATSRDDESGTLVYGLYTDPAHPDTLHTVEVYESKDYLWSVHAKSAAVSENVKNTQDSRTGLKHVFLKLRAGYLYK